MYTAAVLTVSDRSFRGERPDTSGPLVSAILKNAGYEVKETALVPDDQTQIEATLCRLADESNVQLVVTTGGTGFPREM